MTDVTFKISSALKNIIGRDLITDDFIAVFELVKNSFDAQARRVDITFGTVDAVGPEIVIQDDGTGMSETDLKNKWLFVAYSEKKEQLDYRDKIAVTRVYAGAKGIGRFSCDRLGSVLRLYTRKASEGPNWHVLDVNWGLFEKNSAAEFQSIPATYTVTETIPYDLSHGTILEISGLRNTDWDRDKLLRLRRSLERLVNPNQENDAQNFHIELHAPHEIEADKAKHAELVRAGETVEQSQLVNGPIRNFLFELLELKTAKIRVEIASTGETIVTRLEDRGTLIYELIEENPFKDYLKDIRIHLFALNRSARIVFTKRMGVTAREYGSVFVYKNGFRVHPYGNPDDDSLGVDDRHQQGVFRTLGTRDLSGRIEINGLNPDFQETSSRDGGLIRSKALDALKEVFIDIALKRLEKFVIDLAKYGTEKGELLDEHTLSKSEVKEAIFDIVTRLTQAKNVIDVRYDPDFLNILENRSSESVSGLLKNLKRIAANQNSRSLLSEVEKAERHVEALTKAKAEAEAAEAKERERAKSAEAEAREAQDRANEAEEAARRANSEVEEAKFREDQLDTQNIFLKSVLSTDLGHILTLHHTIVQDTLAIEGHVHYLLSLLKPDAVLRPEQLRASLERISYVAKKISAISRFATHANHRIAKAELKSDLIEYVREYLLNVYGGLVFDPDGRPIAIQFHQPVEYEFITAFSPIKISIVFDNLISNSRKHKATTIDVTVNECTDETLVLSFRDNGAGIPKKNIPYLFEIGYTTTDGSGLGLHHVREIMNEIHGSITVGSGQAQGAEFLLTVTKR